MSRGRQSITRALTSYLIHLLVRWSSIPLTAVFHKDEGVMSGLRSAWIHKPKQAIRVDLVIFAFYPYTHTSILRTLLRHFRRPSERALRFFDRTFLQLSYRALGFSLRAGLFYLTFLPHTRSVTPIAFLSSAARAIPAEVFFLFHTHHSHCIQYRRYNIIIHQLVVVFSFFFTFFFLFPGKTYSRNST